MYVLTIAMLLAVGSFISLWWISLYVDIYRVAMYVSNKERWAVAIIPVYSSGKFGRFIGL